MAYNADNRYQTEELDLRELGQMLWASKVLIAVLTLSVTCAAAVYALLSAPIYEATVQTLPPSTKGLANYNVASQLTGHAIRGTVSDTAPGIEPITPQGAYKVFLRHLSSNTIRQSFFLQYYLPAQANNTSEADKQRAWRRLNDELTITLPRRADEYEASVSLQGENPQTIADWTNAYVELGLDAAREDLLSGLAGEVRIRQQSLKDQVEALRQVAERIRQNRIVRLKDALTIAESIGLERPFDGPPWITISTEGVTTDNVTNGSLLYLRGAQALRSELEELERRESNDAYIAEIPDLLKKQALLSNINLNPDLLSVATIDQAAIAPEDPIKPNKRLIVILGFIIGSLLSIFVALIRQLVEKGAKPHDMVQ